MELHSSPSACKKLWNILRVAFFTMRKGPMSKRKLIMDMNLMMQRGKVMGKSLGKSLAFHHPRSSGAAASMPSFGLHEYRFSCANSPNNPGASFRANYSKRKHSYFPCMGASAVDERPDKAPAGPLGVVLVPRIEYKPAQSSSGAAAAALPAATVGDLAHGDQRCTPIIPSPLFAEDGDDDGVGGEVDNRAEEFIKRFYQELHAQGQIALKEQYQDQEMLARGT